MSTQFALRTLAPRFLLPNALFLRQDLSSAGHGVAPCARSNQQFFAETSRAIMQPLGCFPSIADLICNLEIA